MSANNPQQLVLLDRDGVINQDSDDYIRTVDEWHPIAGSIEAIARLSREGYRVAVVTNQSGLSRGYFTLDTLEEIHARLCQLVEEQGGAIDGIFYCPHLPKEGCDCRKPATGLIRALEEELGLSAQGAWLIGDSLKDLQAALAHGCRPVLVSTGKGEGTAAALQANDVDLENPQDIPIFENLAAAVDALLK